ncbi:pyridoxal phosphate-dependent decarboxylase family protein [Nodosilinea sp. PGN35]|uniref:pyridoxal phosphate-dependent decarboxylase family protein n=1 Tax=Nodosilinea sp. PGN35 TaxID=3020489 RepID=UPI0023B2D3E3|nr:aspartate aminotransferase family protein [Nodosilinea sp. TSF1-S3]MDF0369287.1 aspartate aminotransferase family protein [Nodosilinea sp. TSF1-S3]
MPATAFIDPQGHNRAAIAAILQQVVEQILDYTTGAGHHVPLPAVKGVDASGIPAQPTAIAPLLEALGDLMAQSMNPAHPGYMGHMDPLPSTASIVGDWVAAALNNNMLSVEMSPALSRLEPLLLAELAQLFGLGEKAGGLLTSGGTLANLQALTVARNVKLDCLRQGLAGGSPPVILASEMAHTSIQKAAMVLGLGLEGVVLVPTNAQGQMDAAALDEKIRGAIARGQRPFAVVATAGTTVTGNIDPLPAIARIAQDYGLWFHVDAAYGGAIAFSPAQRHRLTGIERADSVTFNPQKWLYVTKTCASVLFRDLDLLHSHFRVSAPYMNSEADWVNLGELSVQGTRHGDVLKLWLTLQHLGMAGCAELIEASYALSDRFVAEVQRRPYLELASPPEMNVICFRGCPPGLPPDQRDAWNIGLQTYLLSQHQTFLSAPGWRGQRWLKAVLLNPFTTVAQVSQLFLAMDHYSGGTAA